MYLFIIFIQLHLIGSFQQICSDIQATKYGYTLKNQMEFLVENLLKVEFS